MATRPKTKIKGDEKVSPLPPGYFILPSDGLLPGRAFRFIEVPEREVVGKVTITPTALGEYMLSQMVKANEQHDLQGQVEHLEHQVEVLRDQVETLGGTPKPA